MIARTDQGVAADEDVIKLVEDLEVRLRTNPEEILYIHCWGGHGRTGTIVCCLLGRVDRLLSCSIIRSLIYTFWLFIIMMISIIIMFFRFLPIPTTIKHRTPVWNISGQVF